MHGAARGRSCAGELDVTWRKLVCIAVVAVPLAPDFTMALARPCALGSGAIGLGFASW